jgi:hypothetical protein
MLAVGQLEEAVGAAGFGVGRAQLAPNQAIDQSQAGAYQPGQQEVWPHEAHYQRQGHEGPDANHVNHIQGRGLHQAQTALQRGLRHETNVGRRRPSRPCQPHEAVATNHAAAPSAINIQACNWIL